MSLEAEDLSTAPVVADKIWTYEDYCELPEDGNRYEILDGRLYVTPAPRTFHEILTVRLVAALLASGQIVLTAPVDLMLVGATPVQPDLVFLTREQAHQIEERYITGAPTLVVEILSPSTAARDRTLKLNKYAQNQIPWYWLVDPEEKSLQVLRLEGGSYRVEASLGAGERFVWSAFPQVVLELDTLFGPI
ncbi:MAG: hypothetical protein AMXMBFR33_53730 [Candidatus Xenobia bacterium]